ncbi:MAG: alcohol dehydrogenase catalytic domain-containing protein [Henriciella sp.]|uniref:alcohol dehydrogenase catalytic domain-containing protein n=1 Tax=Henriciella sp. TaxID=1968823 RepID=UPI0032F05D2B
MKALELKTKAPESGIKIIDLDEPQVGPGLVLVRIRAASINFHDLAVIRGQLQAPGGRVLLSDAAGDVVAVGEGVERFSVGDRVISRFFPAGFQVLRLRNNLAGSPVIMWMASQLNMSAFMSRQ